MNGKIQILWGEGPVGEPPNDAEIADILTEFKIKAATSNAVHLTVSHGMVQWLKDNLDNAYVLVVMEDTDSHGNDWIIVGVDKESVKLESSRI